MDLFGNIKIKTLNVSQQPGVNTKCLIIQEPPCYFGERQFWAPLGPPGEM